MTHPDPIEEMAEKQEVRGPTEHNRRAFSSAADAAELQTVAKGLRALRKAAALTQEQVARGMGVPPQQIQVLERGKHSPSVKTLERYAAACGATLRLDFAPIWSSGQCDRLNDYQRNGHFHPFTCGGERGDEAHRAYAEAHDDRDYGLLTATRFGWRCPVCSYTQTWAHSFMFESPPADGPKGHGTADPSNGPTNNTTPPPLLRGEG